MIKILNRSMASLGVVTGVLAIPGVALCQTVSNQGADIYIAPGALMFSNGLVHNSSGNIENQGTLEIDGGFTNDATSQGSGDYDLTGDWTNNATFQQDMSHVIFNGTAQSITGSAVTTFHDVTLMNASVKSQTLDARVDATGTLDLTDCELANDVYKMHVDNPSAAAINRTTGFVSATGAGRLVRATNSTSTYLFPTGSSVGALRYRPVELTPSATTATSYEIRFVNNDPNIDGYLRTNTEVGVCAIEPDWYHLIDHAGGVDADLSLFYDQPSDGDWNGIGNHNSGIPQWENTSAATVTTVAPFERVSISAWNDWTNAPYALVNQGTPPVADAGSDFTIDCNNTVATLDGSASTAGMNYQWDDAANSTTQSTTETSAGDFILIVTDPATGCVDSDTMSVIADMTPPVADAGPDATLTCSNTMVILDGSASDAGMTYQWDDAANSTSQSTTETTTGVYTITVTDPSNGCSATDQMLVMVDTTAPVADAGPDFAIDCVDPVAVLDGSGSSPGMDYQWDDAANSTTQSTTETNAGTYTLIVTDPSNGCSSADQMTVTVNVVPAVADAGPDETISLGGSVTLTGSGGVTYSWTPSTGLDCDDCAAPVASPDTTTEYILTVTSVDGCTDTDTVVVRVNTDMIDVFVQNIFTPNGDGLNDEAMVDGPALTDFQFNIYSRWGELLYSSTDPAQGWDGMHKDKEAEADVYVYTLQCVVIATGEVIDMHGDITLIR